MNRDLIEAQLLPFGLAYPRDYSLLMVSELWRYDFRRYFSQYLSTAYYCR